MKLLLYKLSVIVLLSAHGMDITSSWGKCERNYLLSSPNGKFQMRGTAIKVGIVTGWVVSQNLVIRKYPATRNVFTALNLVEAGVVTTVAVTNFGVERSERCENVCKDVH